MQKPQVILAGLLGIILIIVSIFYFITPAGSLPGFFPGHENGSSHIHFKHGIGALLLGLACMAYAWFQSGSKKKHHTEHHSTPHDKEE
jgi:hypothetical protein